MHRILVGGLFHEGNSFSPLPTTAGGFAVVEGDDVIEKARRSGAGLGGAYRYLASRDVEIVPFRKATASPGGPVEDDFYLEFRDALTAASARGDFDGIYLELHGSMLTASLDDPEGDLLLALRAAVGLRPVIAVSLDLHAYVTDRMLESANVIVACKENPHSDFHVAGELAASLMLRAIDGDIRPVTCAARVPLFIGAKMETAAGPLAALHDLRRRLLVAYPSILDISIYNTQTLLDVPDAGQCITVITDGDPNTALAAAGEIATAFWEARDGFEPDNPPLADVLDELEQGRLARPAILGDGGDNALAGTPGDGTAIIREILERRPRIRAVVPVTDPAVVAEAIAAGKGGTLDTCVGGKFSKGVDPVCGAWEVISLSDGRFTMAGPFLANEPAELGGTAVLRRGNLTLLVTSRPGFTQDVAAFRSQELEPGDFDVVAVKSNHHYKLSFADVGPCITVDTPGLTSYRKGSLPFVKRRPIYPDDPMTADDIAFRTF